MRIIPGNELPGYYHVVPTGRARARPYRSARKRRELTATAKMIRSPITTS
jgi:hypothetical protein